MSDIVYVAIHRVTFEDGNPANNDDTMLGCFKKLEDAKERIEKYLKTLNCNYFKKTNILNVYDDFDCCDICTEIYAKEFDGACSGERCSVYKCKIH